MILLLLLITFGIIGSQHSKSVAKEASSESSAKAASESSAKAASKSSAKAASESSAKAASESSAKAASESSAKAASESSAKAASESSAKAASESSAKAASESSAKAASESNVQAFSSSIEQQANESSANNLMQSTPLSKNAKSYLKKVNKLTEGTAQFATYDEDINELTYIGFDSWSDYSHSDLQSMMDILETVANRQAVVHNIHNPLIEVKLPDGTLIAQNDGNDDIEFVN